MDWLIIIYDMGGKACFLLDKSLLRDLVKTYCLSLTKRSFAFDLSLQLLFHFFYPSVGGGADEGVFDGQVINLIYFLSIGMGEFSAGFRANFVDIAGVILV